MKLLPLALILALSVVSCRKHSMIVSMPPGTPDTLIAGTVIKTAGTWSATTEKSSRHLEITEKSSRHLEVTVSGTSISWSIESREMHPGGGSSSGSDSSGISVSSPSDPWFIFVESPQRLWFFNGKNELNYSLSDGGGSRGGPAIVSGQLHPTTEVIPPEIVPHLPADLQKLFPPVKPAEKRPSI